MVANAPMSTQVGMLMEDFIHANDSEGRFELIDGERVPKLPTVSEHSEILRRLYNFLLRLEDQGQTVAYQETTYVLTHHSNWVIGARIPDLMVYRADRLIAYKQADSEWRAKPLVLVPDLCVEVISPNDTYAEVDAKVARYLQDGVPLIWVFNPRSTSIIVYRSGEIVRLTADETLEGGEIVPGFSILVKDIFAI